jgi:hypothetical protein
MENAMPDLWPEELKTLEITPPSSILREQADLLKKKTNGLVEGRVEVMRSSENDERLRIAFYLVAPNLDEYSYRLLVVNHPMSYYPLTIESHSKASLQCANEEAFMNALKNIFKSDPTTNTIGALMAQSGAEKQAYTAGSLRD